jgi:3-oxoacyl-[acyl-carrier protein] reductase
MSERRRTALVTGSAGEIGGQLAAHLLAAGWNVLGIDRVAPASVPDGLVFARCDLADGADAARVLEALAATHGACDLLVNCAGRIANAPLVTLGPAGWTVHDFDLWADVIASGLTTTFHATALVAGQMLAAKRRGVIINISSVCASGNPGQAAYSAAKAGVNGLTRALGKELGPLGIRVVGLAPGYFDTASTRANVAAARLPKIAAAVPVRRLGQVHEICAAVDFIVANDYVNATVLSLDGGLVV